MNENPKLLIIQFDWWRNYSASTKELQNFENLWYCEWNYIASAMIGHHIWGCITHLQNFITNVHSAINIPTIWAQKCISWNSIREISKRFFSSVQFHLKKHGYKYSTKCCIAPHVFNSKPFIRVYILLQAEVPSTPFNPTGGSNSWPPDHDSTFHITETPALTTWPSVTLQTIKE